MAQIGIVIVTYSSGAEIGSCLEAAQASGADIIVVDNASPDGTVDEVNRRGARLIANQKNLGFAAAVNQGIRALDCPYILLLNPDAVIEGGIEDLRAACDLPGAAGAGGLLLESDGKPQVGFMARSLPTPAVLALEALLLNRLWPGNPINRRYRELKRDYSTRCVVEQPAGAFLMIRREVWAQLGGFDERFCPLWFEDVDFCRRAWQAGYTFHYQPKAAARHAGGHSISKISMEMRVVYWYSNLIKYAEKHFSSPGYRAVCLAVMAGSLLRGFAQSAFNRSLAPFRAYWRVARFAGGSLVSGRSKEVVLSR